MPLHTAAAEQQPTAESSSAGEKQQLISTVELRACCFLGCEGVLRSTSECVTVSHSATLRTAQLSGATEIEMGSYENYATDVTTRRQQQLADPC